VDLRQMRVHRHRIRVAWSSPPFVTTVGHHRLVPAARAGHAGSMTAERPERGTPRRSAWAVACLVTATAAVAIALQARSGDDWPDEARRLASVLAIPPSATIAEIGAGRGELTVEMARRVPGGRAFSTEIDLDRLGDIERAVAKAGLRNVTVLEAGARESRLPEGCCDVVYMREVYHHFDDGPVMTATIHRALKPGGVMAVIDYPERGPADGNCHCIAKPALIAQVTAQGFEVVADEDRWSGTRYLVVFRKR
jgi:ubiquinone/menaquinone biosynthesis C-methylase UbiE